MQAHATTRRARFAALANSSVDVLVVGGGITGCGIARDAALRGLSVALIEKNDFASGTSSRSSRLVHGGVRYLETGQVHLVFESSAERRRLLELAPHLVHPLAFTWPVYDHARISRWKLGAGLLAYDVLAMFRNVARHERLTREEVLEHEPMLSGDGLRGGARYFDAATNDARLTLANALDAAERGAVVLNHAVARSLLVENGRVCGASVADCLEGSAHEVRARVVVNATGPWSDEVASLDASPEHQGSSHGVRGSKGAHIEVRRDRIGNRGALTLLAPQDGRVAFVLPAEEFAIIGTTDGYTSASPDQVRAAREDVQYLLEMANAYFPQASLGESDIVSAWAGIRPLVPAAGESSGAASREHAVAVDARGLVSITGGKLTTYRIMAADTMREVIAQLNHRAVRHDPTRDVRLPGGDFDSLDAVIAEATRATGDEALAKRLAHTYGTRWAEVWTEMDRDGGAARIGDALPYTVGELRYSVREEMACTLGDLLIRRTHAAHEAADHAVSVAPLVADSVRELLGWDESARARAIDAYAAEVNRIFGIDG